MLYFFTQIKLKFEILLKSLNTCSLVTSSNFANTQARNDKINTKTP